MSENTKHPHDWIWVDINTRTQKIYVTTPYEKGFTSFEIPIGAMAKIESFKKDPGLSQLTLSYQIAEKHFSAMIVDSHIRIDQIAEILGEHIQWDE